MKKWVALLMRSVDSVRRFWLRLWGVRMKTIETTQGNLRFLEVEGTGSLPPMLLVHGLSSMAVDWGQIILRLKGHCQRVRALDLPGHGLSDVPTGGMVRAAMEDMLGQAADTLLDRPQVFVGNSLGGLVSIRLAQRFPERVHSLALVSPAGARVEESSFRAILDLFQIDSHRKAMVFVDALLASWVPFRWPLALGVRVRVSRPSVRELVAGFSMDSLLEPEELSSLTMPVLLYWGQEDDILGADHLAYYCEHLPDSAEVITPKRMGHSPFLASPRRFLEPLVRFCEEPKKLSHEGGEELGPSNSPEG